MSRDSDNGGIARRQLLQGAALTAASGWAARAAGAQGAGRISVVFLSRSSNTRMLAGHLSRRFAADLFEIRPRDPWPDDYDQMVAWASRWRENGQLLPLASTPDLSGHGTVFLGFPIWGAALPAPMHSLLSSVDLTGKVVLPFITHGGYGAGSSVDELRRLTAAATVADPFILQCDQERDNLDALRTWLGRVATEIPSSQAQPD